MKLYSKNEYITLYNDNMLNMLEDIETNSIDSIVTDPPYELGFMGKSWDSSGIAFQKSTWEKCFQVLKPGGHLLAFGGSRTYHRIACAIEDAGFEIRDCIMWIYGSGFPKSMNIGLAIDKKNGVDSPIVGQNQDILKKQAKDLRDGHRKIVDSLNGGASNRNNGFKTVSADIKQAQNEWDGWGTQLKPSYEPIIVARKPIENSIVDNVIKWGVGGINIDECRVPVENTKNAATNPLYRLQNEYRTTTNSNAGDSNVGFGTSKNETNELGRFPANTILTYDDNDFDEVCSGFPNTKSTGGSGDASIINSFKNVYGKYKGIEHTSHLGGLHDEGSAARYFYCAKASKRDRDDGLERFEEKELITDMNSVGCKDGVHYRLDGLEISKRRNTHPTVKPTCLMQYLIRLITPKGGTILDPFMGSGSTGKAAMYENIDRNANYKFIGIELTDEYLPICKERIEYAMQDTMSLIVDGEEIIKTKKTNKRKELW